ncbi:hypothetical protein [Streptomyces sp. NPDC059008]|uniref:hypothetical protein n=1 Tax=Streptomyces sp. NPDC059008 TaxID=3346693 RepID=UPI0036C203E1
MTARPHLPTKSPSTTPTTPSFAEPARTPSGSGAPEGAARRASVHALRPDPRQATQRGAEPVFYGLHIVAEPEWHISVTAACPCGYQRRAKSRDAVVPLIEDYARHKKACTRHTGMIERRHVA